MHSGRAEQLKEEGRHGRSGQSRSMSPSSRVTNRHSHVRSASTGLSLFRPQRPSDLDVGRTANVSKDRLAPVYSNVMSRSLPGSPRQPIYKSSDGIPQSKKPKPVPGVYRRAQTAPLPVTSSSSSAQRRRFGTVVPPTELGVKCVPCSVEHPQVASNQGEPSHSASQPVSPQLSSGSEEDKSAQRSHEKSKLSSPYVRGSSSSNAYLDLASPLSVQPSAQQPSHSASGSRTLTLDRRLSPREQFFAGFGAGYDEEAELEKQRQLFRDLYEEQQKLRSDEQSLPVQQQQPRTREEFFADLGREARPKKARDSGFERSSSVPGWHQETTGPSMGPRVRNNSETKERKLTREQFFADLYGQNKGHANSQETQRPPRQRSQSPAYQRHRTREELLANLNNMQPERKHSNPEYPTFWEEEELGLDGGRPKGSRQFAADLNQALNEPMPGTKFQEVPAGQGQQKHRRHGHKHHHKNQQKHPPVQLSISPPSPISPRPEPHAHVGRGQKSTRVDHPREYLRLPSDQTKGKKLCRSHSNPEYAAEFARSYKESADSEAQSASMLRPGAKRLMRSQSCHLGEEDSAVMRQNYRESSRDPNMQQTYSLLDFDVSHGWCYLYWSQQDGMK